MVSYVAVVATSKTKQQKQNPNKMEEENVNNNNDQYFVAKLSMRHAKLLYFHEFLQN